jgi:hypothetical protein
MVRMFHRRSAAVCWYGMECAIPEMLKTWRWRYVSREKRGFGYSVLESTLETGDYATLRAPDGDLQCDLSADHFRHRVAHHSRFAP